MADPHPPTSVLVATDRRLERLGPGGERVTVVDAPVTCMNDGLAVIGGHSLARIDGDRADVLAEAPDGTGLACVAVAAGEVLVGTVGGHLLRLDGGRLAEVEGFERLPGRDGWYTPWGDPADTRWLSAAGAEVWAAVHVGGIHRSGDGGVTWENTAFDIDDDVHQIVALGGGRAVAACAAGSVATVDGGRTWTLTTAGLPVRYARSVAVAASGAVLVGVADGPGEGSPAVLRSPLPGSPFEPVRGIPEPLGGVVDTGTLLARGDSAVLVSPAGTVSVSSDAGATWESLTPGNPEPSRVSGRPTGVAFA